MRTLDDVVEQSQRWLGMFPTSLERESLRYLEQYQKVTDILHEHGIVSVWGIVLPGPEKVKGKPNFRDIDNSPLSWDELCRIDMIGEPVWNSGTRRWMLLIDSGSDNTWIELVNHAGGRERWIEHDLRLAPLYRKPKEK